MKLKELMTMVDYEVEQLCHNDEIEQIAYDSRKAAPGSLFVCISGLKEDGHYYAKDAVANGANTINCGKTSVIV